MTKFFPAFGLGPLAAALLLTGSASSQPAAATQPADGATQPKVNRLLVGTVPPAAETNEVRNVNQRDQYQTAPAYERLFANHEVTGNREGQLVTEWSVEPSGLAYRFKLRQGVKFHFNAGTLTSKDIVTTFKEHIRDDSLRGSSPNLRASIKAVTPVNDFEFLLELTRPAAELLYAAGQADVISHDHFTANGPATLDKPTAGTGPYFVQSRTQGQSVRFERVPYEHWRLKPDFPELEVRFMKEPSTRLAALISGEIHATDIPEDLQQQATSRAGFKVIGGTASAQRVWVEFYGPIYADPSNPGVGYLHGDSPLADPRLRRVLSKAIDRKQLNESFLQGKGKPMYQTHYGPDILGWNPDWERRFPDEYGYDPARARALLAEAGYGPGKPVSLTMLVIDVEGLSSGKDIAEAVGAYWNAIGVEAKLEDMPTARYNELSRAKRLNAHARIRTSGTDIYNAITNIVDGYRETRTSGISIPAGDDAYKLAKNTLDEKQQDTYLRQAGNVWYDQHHSAPLFWLPQEVVVNTKIVAGYPFPGNVTGSWTHMEYIKAVR